MFFPKRNNFKKPLFNVCSLFFKWVLPSLLLPSLFGFNFLSCTCVLFRGFLLASCHFFNSQFHVLTHTFPWLTSLKHFLPLNFGKDPQICNWYFLLLSLLTNQQVQMEKNNNHLLCCNMRFMWLSGRAEQWIKFKCNFETATAGVN